MRYKIRMSRTVLRHRFCALVVSLSAAGMMLLCPLATASSAAGTTQVRVLVVRSTWGPQPYSDSEVNTAMQGVTRFFAVASFGKVAMTYTTTPWLKVMPGPMSCADEELRLPGLVVSAGWNPDSYDRVVYLFPDPGQSGCAFTFEDPPKVLINGALPVGAVIHELGHTFGMGHAGLLTCWYEQTLRLCSGDPYGDTSDAMSGAGSSILKFVGDFGGLQKARAGWLTPRYITKPGIYKLAPLEVASTLPQALVIRGVHYEYWIDEREAAGNDSHVSGPEMTGFAVHRIAEDPFAPGADPLMPDYLVPNAHTSSYYTAPGKTFTLPGVFTLTALSRTRGVMSIRFRSLAGSR